jgi:7-cyano-7-deazaguanine synthase in queuosine biosynthesis
MANHDCGYDFGEIRSQHGSLRATDYRQCVSNYLQVSVDDSQLDLSSFNGVSSRIADLVDIAVAVYVADRLSVREGDTTCRIQISLPVRHPEVLNRKEIYEQLTDVLYWYTGDHWLFDFSERQGFGRPSELQRRLFLSNGFLYPLEVALWSGGLDSLAGLCNRFLSGRDIQYVLFGTGGNTYIHRVQQRVAQRVRQQFGMNSCVSLAQVPIHLSEISNLKKNRDMRARGFVFLLLGSACALSLSQGSLFIYENGIGAINLPFRPSEVGLDHARSVHPRSLAMMSELVSLILESPFSFINPFFFWTKAQMCEVFTRTASTELISITTTCDRRHRKKPGECGWCSSCLLRKQALAAYEIRDPTQYVVPHGREPSMADRLHLGAMLDQVTVLDNCLRAHNPWQSLTKQYPSLLDIVDETTAHLSLSPDEMSGRLVQLYSKYVTEWGLVNSDAWDGGVGELICGIAPENLNDDSSKGARWKPMSLIQ